jgi:Flp pilus assembly pilin Flp
MRNLLNDETGFVISAELVLVLTIGVLAMIVGLSEVGIAVNTELNDISNAIGALGQGYSFTGFKGTDAAASSKAKSSYSGTTFIESTDDCDLNSSCDLVCGASATATTES